MNNRLLKAALGCVMLFTLIGCAGQQTSTAPSAQSKDVTQYVDPFIGTDGKGKTYPGATLPYGMVQLSPDNGRNGWDWISGYFYPDDVIAGFSHTHLSGTGAGDLYDISFMPLVGKPQSKKLDDVKTTATTYSTFSHDNEAASPGYYQVFLESYDINVELTAALRTGLQRYQFSPNTTQGRVKLDLGYARNWDKTLDSHIQIIDDHSIAGYRKSTGWAKDQRVYFYTEFSQPFATHKITQSGAQNTHKQASGTDIASLFFFELDENKTVEVRTAISSVSIDNAKQNFAHDDPSLSFEQIRQQASTAWQQALGKVQVSASEDNKTQFYTALYHSFLAPRVFSDANGQYKGPDGNIHQSQGMPRYSFFSLWDTFRALHPWKTITEPQASKQMMQSLLAHYKEYGLLPVWNFQGNETDMMMGYHAVPVLADAYFKGLTDADPEYLYQAMKKSAMQDAFSIDDYKQLGYVPVESGKWNVSKTLEYAFDDWAIAQMAKSLGKEDDYQYFLGRSQNYRQHFDKASQFMRARQSDGNFKPHFDPLAYDSEDYCEANAWQYNFFVPHDVDGLIGLMGGNHPFNAKLDKMFSTLQGEDELPEWISGYIGQYVHGNEPAHHVPYLYQFSGAPHKTQARVRQIMDQLYNTTPNGLCGNEDAGQMSAWYMFSALGFYPVNPASGDYVLGSPEVDSAQITLDNGKVFSVIANNQSPKNVYVKSVSLNGKPLNRYTITHQEIMQGGQLVFTMSESPK
ncbi:GH92 family glycosyl hydrolase [uncultured Paraglaciecola sp.]|uniref:GH92 family glycosyl hydrolase n=1 Tax=uncultured Paraglaciecola sp. TaxID=1765024 RepID=UPI0026184503|nr:GH92 family glycosyl hydrolase [uncultured Paraglaciecola sp.]